MATMNKSSKCSRELITQNFEYYELSLSLGPDLSTNTIPDVSFLFKYINILKHRKILGGIPLRLKVFREVLKSMFTAVNAEFVPDSLYKADRLSLLRTCTIKFIKYINAMVEYRFDNIWRNHANKIFWEGYFEKD